MSVVPRGWQTADRREAGDGGHRGLSWPSERAAASSSHWPRQRTLVRSTCPHHAPRVGGPGTSAPRICVQQGSECGLAGAPVQAPRGDAVSVGWNDRAPSRGASGGRPASADTQAGRRRAQLLPRKCVPGLPRSVPDAQLVPRTHPGASAARLTADCHCGHLRSSPFGAAVVPKI